MARKIKNSMFLSLVMLTSLAAQSAVASGLGDSCCHLALRRYNNALNNIRLGKSNNLIDSLILEANTNNSAHYVCGQIYPSSKRPAPDFRMQYQVCSAICGGYAPSPASDVNAWVIPLAQYLLPIIIFSMTIPRRLILEPPRWCFKHRIFEKAGPFKIVLSLIIAAPTLILDTTIWIFTIITFAGSLIYSGLDEAVQDYRIVTNLLDGYKDLRTGCTKRLCDIDITQIITAVLCGNLELPSKPQNHLEEVNNTVSLPNPQEELKRALAIKDDAEQSDVDRYLRTRIMDQLRAVLTSQSGFGPTVGGPILFYVFSFVSNIVQISSMKGDRNIALAIAFGIWWMCIGHVAIVNGCLLASSNPSVASAICALEDEPHESHSHQVNTRDRSVPTNRFQVQTKYAKVEDYLGSRLARVYKLRYQPVWMWDRGANKARWLRNTDAWKDESFRRNVESAWLNRLGIFLGATLLTFIPIVFALLITLTTPQAGVSCRSLTLIVYGSAQLIFIVRHAWKDFKAANDEQFMKPYLWFGYFHCDIIELVSYMIFFIPALIAAVFTTFAGTLMQLTGIYANCACGISAYYWINRYHTNATLSLASDTQSQRDASRQWYSAAIMSLVVLTVVTSLGYWFQRHLREMLNDAIDLLAQSSTPEDPLELREDQRQDGVEYVKKPRKDQ